MNKNFKFDKLKRKKDKIWDGWQFYIYVYKYMRIIIYRSMKGYFTHQINFIYSKYNNVESFVTTKCTNCVLWH